MAASSGLFGLTLRDVFDASQIAVNIDADAFKNALYNNTRTPNYDTDVGYVTTNEVTGTGYTAGGAAPASQPTIAASAGLLTIAAGDTSWTGATISSVRQRVFYDDTLAGNNGIANTDFGGNNSVTSGTLTIQENASGIATIDYTP